MLFKKNNLANSKKRMDKMLDPVMENENIPTDAPSDVDQSGNINNSNAAPNHYMNTSFGVKPPSPSDARPNSSQTDMGTQPLMPGDMASGSMQGRKGGKKPAMPENKSCCNGCTIF